MTCHPLHHGRSGLALAAWLAVALPSQQPETPEQHFAKVREQLTADALTQLRSTDPATIAWGAHAAAEFRLAGCVPELKKQLAAVAPTAQDKTNSFVALALLDALIQTNARVPGESLRPFVEGITQASALTLLLPRADEESAVLLEAFRHCHRGSHAHQRCGQALAGWNCKAPGFAVELLRQPLWIVMTVLDEGQAATAEPAGLGRYTGCVRLRPPKGFPPCIQYGLEPSERVSGEWLVDAASDLESREFLDAHTKWMRQLLGTGAPATPFDLMPLVNVEWSGLEALRAREQEERTKAQAMHKALVEQCTRAGLITAAEAKDLTATLRVFWMDARSKREPHIEDDAGH